MILNRIFNFFVVIFLNRYNDYTNAFKIYKDVLKTLLPFVSESFMLFLRNSIKDN